VKPLVDGLDFGAMAVSTKCPAESTKKIAAHEGRLKLVVRTVFGGG
jgi:hypothetical protein